MVKIKVIVNRKVVDFENNVSSFLNKIINDPYVTSYDIHFSHFPIGMHHDIVCYTATIEYHTDKEEN